MGAWHRSLKALASPRGPLWFALVAGLLSLPALRLGLQADDHMFAEQVALGAVPDWEFLRLPPQRAEELRASGGLAWWSSPRLSVHFLRPLAALTHTFEFRHYLSAPWLMLLVNVVLYAAAVGLCAALYRRLSPSVPVALLASWMFAIDEAHAGVVSWISARNALLCALFSFAALLSQIEARATRRRWLQVLSVLCVALALGSGESGVWALALLVAYAISFEPNGPAARLITIWPQLAIGAAWAAVYLGGGYGVHGSSLYRELSQPLSVLLQGIADLPLWVTSSFGPSVVTIFAAFPAATGRLVTLPLALLLLWLLWPALARSPQCRFFALSAALGVAPLFATVPQDRLTLGIGFGTFGWLACFLAETQHRWARRTLLALHAILPLALFPLLLGSSGVQLEKGTQALLPLQAGAGQVVLVNSPVEILNGYVRTMDTRPRSFHTLYAGGGDLLLTRVAPDALEVGVPLGWGHTPIERVFGTARDLPHTGEVREPREMRVEVLESTDDQQHPRRVRFTFPTPLESPDRTWLRWEGRRPVRFTPPPLGTELRIGGQNTLAALPR